MFSKTEKYLIAITTLFTALSVSLIQAMNDRERVLVEHVQQSIEKAQANSSKLEPAVLDIVGMSGIKGRHLLNNLCSLPNTHYFEIGIHRGSTFIAALYKNNPASAIAIDNWSEFGNVKNEFLHDAHAFIAQVPFHFYDENCFTINKQLIFKNKVNVYFYDAEHSTASQEKAFTYFNDVFDDTFIAVVDDYNWEQVRQGTESAFKKLNYTIVFETFLTNHTYPDREGWWNGLYVAVISKQ